jgi:hypothetical protein
MKVADLPLLAFVDEIGDRGHSKKSSEYFAMSAVIFPASFQQKVKDCIASIKTEFGLDLRIPLHWRKHCQRHDFRKYVAGKIAKLENITVIYVISDKKTIPEDTTKFYNIVAAYTLEEILKYAGKEGKKVSVRFGHVKNFNHTTTIDFFNDRNWRLCEYHRLTGQPKWIKADDNSGIQLADIYSGILGAAMIADRFGNYEDRYLETVKHQLRSSSEWKVSGYGIRAISIDNDPKSFKWWPEGWE